MLRTRLAKVKGLVFAVLLYSVYVFRNQIISFSQGDRRLIIELKQDATLYLGQIQLGLTGQSIGDNPFWRESSSEAFIGRNYGLYLIGRVFGMFGINLTLTFLITVLSIGTLLVISIYKVNNFYTSNTYVNFGVTTALSVLVFGDFAFRPSPTQWALPFFILALIGVYKTQLRDNVFRKMYKFFLLSTFIFFVNPFYSILLAILCGLFIIENIQMPKMRLKLYLLFCTIAFIIGAVFQNIVQTSSSFELVQRWGLLFSHFPGSAGNSLILLIVAATNLYLLKNSTWKHQSRFVLYLSLSTLLAMQQNVFTGIWWEPESHYHYIVIICVYLTTCNVVKVFAKIGFKLFSSTHLLLSVQVSLSFLFLVSLSDFTRLSQINNFHQAHKGSVEIQELAQLLSSNSTPNDLIAMPVSLGEEATWAAILANRKFIWNYQGSLLSGSDSEILTRYLCNFRKNFQSPEEIPDIKYTQGHRYLNASQHFSKWIFLPSQFSRLTGQSDESLRLKEKARAESVLPFFWKSECSSKEFLTATKLLISRDGMPQLIPAN